MSQTELHASPGGTQVHGDVHVQDGDFVGRDKIDMLIETVENYVAGNYVDQTRITQVFNFGPATMEAVMSWVNQREGLGDGTVRSALAQQPRDPRQLREFELAQQAADNVPLTGESAYQFGLAAAHRRDYVSALRYFHAVPEESARFVEACEAVAWLQQSLAMRDIQRRDYASAKERLQSAKAALDKIEKLSARTHELYGYIAKSLAQIADRQGDNIARNQYYDQAKTHFEKALELDEKAAGAVNGLGNIAYAMEDYDRAIELCLHATELSSNYTAAYNDLGLAYEGKLKTDKDNRSVWLQEATAAFRKAAELAVNDPGFNQSYPARIENHIQQLNNEYGSIE